MDAIQITTGGVVGRPLSVTISTHGYIYQIAIEEIPIEDVRSGGGPPAEAGESLKKRKKRKLIKVTLTYKNKQFVKTKEVNDDVKVTQKNVKVKWGKDDTPKITISVRNPRSK